MRSSRGAGQPGIFARFLRSGVLAGVSILALLDPAPAGAGQDGATNSATNSAPAREEGVTKDAPDDKPFERVRRPRAVKVDEEYDVSGLTLPLEEIHELLPRDAIASLTDPKLEDAAAADWMGPADRVIDVTIGTESVAVPFRILNFHEIANLTVGGEAIAATY